MLIIAYQDLEAEHAPRITRYQQYYHIESNLKQK